MQNTARYRSLQLFVLSGLVVAAGFLPWVSYNLSAVLGDGFGKLFIPLVEGDAGVNAYKSNMTLMGILIPNWLVVVAAVAVPVVTWIDLISGRKAVARSAFLLVTFGLLHTVLAMILAGVSQDASIASGLPLTFALLIAMFVWLRRISFALGSQASTTQQTEAGS